MAETLVSIPSEKRYTWPKINLPKEALEKDTAEIWKLGGREVIEKLKDYINHQPGKDPWENTFELMALYQRALQLLWYDSTVDALFSRNMYTALKKAQGEKLELTWNDIDGLPGPKTTIKLITALQKNETKKQPKLKTTLDGEALTIANTFLKGRWFTIVDNPKTNNPKKIYHNPNMNMMIQIDGDRVDYLHDLWSNFGQRKELTTEEREIIGRLSKILKG